MMDTDTSLIDLRRTLHQFPELSGQEQDTVQRILSYVGHQEPSQIIEELGGHGLALVYAFPNPGPTVAIRCELDALPIQEINDFEYQSTIDGVSHKCGHDGHMTIISGLAKWITRQPFDKGKMVLLFQPAEETGKGAEAVLKDPRFEALGIDYMFALHNIPKAPLHEIIVMDRGFSAEVISFKLELQGLASHAAEPEHGINPASTIAHLISSFENLNIADHNRDDFAVLTPVHLNMGQPAYGVSPANGELHYTIRTWSSDSMQCLKEKINEIVQGTCTKHRLGYLLNWFEYFPASPNNKYCNQLIKSAAQEHHFSMQERLYPFKFGEDFGWFAQSYPTAMFGLGAGLNTPALHNADYDFPDEIIDTGLKMFQSILRQLLMA